MKQEIDCPDCGGKGRVPLPDHLLNTLSLVPRNGYRVAEDFANYFPGITINGISNRLAELHRLGFVTRERNGKFWCYSRTKAKKGK